MTGNDFLKYSPHRNLGDMPYAHYNLMRFQMEAANIPFMQRRVPGGVLKVKQIYKHNFKVEWLPDTPGINVCYMLQYRDETGTDMVKFYDQYFIPVVTAPATGVQAIETDTGASVLNVHSHILQISDDLFCVNGDGAIDSQTFYFYSVKKGHLLNEYSYTSGASLNQLNIYAIAGSLYECGLGFLNKIVPSYDEDTGLYSFTVYDISHDIFRCEDGKFLRGGASSLYDIGDCNRKLADLCIINPDTNDIIETKAVSGTPGNPHSMYLAYDVLYTVECTNGPLNELTFTQQYPWGSESGVMYVAGTNAYNNASFPDIRALSRASYQLYYYQASTHKTDVFPLSNGSVRLSGTVLEGFSSSYLPESWFIVEWRLSDIPKVNPICLLHRDTNVSPITEEMFYSLDQTQKTFSQLCNVFQISESCEELYEFKYLPHLERDPILKTILVNREVG